jgi:PAS domain S-box-containing protein
MQRFRDHRLAKIIEQANALIFVLDSERRVVFLNGALATLMGRHPDQIRGTDLGQWLPPSEHTEFQRAFQRSLRGEDVVGFDLGFVAEDGATVRGLFNLGTLTDSEDRVESVVAIGQDRTAFKILEHQVIQAEKLATLGQLAAGVVHEINNPLTSVSVYAEYLLKKFRRDGGDPGDVSMLEKILEGANRILKCVRDLVNYAKPSSGRLDVLSLNAVVERSVSFCEHILEKSKAEVHRELAGELPPIYGVEDQLQQVLINLITNACQALGPQGGGIWVRTMRCGEREVAMEVADTGCGIGERDLEHIFAPFFTTKPPGEGTGLGLSIVKKIVDHHDGAIVVRSQLGHGTTMSVTLPIGPRHGSAQPED